MAVKNEPECSLDFSNVSDVELKVIANKLANFLCENTIFRPSPISGIRRTGKSDFHLESQSKVDTAATTGECEVIRFSGGSRQF